jgi:pyridoxal phosphate enzyme (YggS family)
MIESITTRFINIRDEVRELSLENASSHGRTEILVVTKRQPIDRCLEVIEAGARIIGENYADEAMEKYSNQQLHGVALHMIGHLQSRKIKMLDPLFSAIESIDTFSLAKKVNYHYDEIKKEINVLLEVDYTRQDTKSGFKINSVDEEEQFISIVKNLRSLSKLNIVGLMTMGFFPENPETNRQIFKKTRNLFEKIRERYNYDDFSELSMGTSKDYKTAIDEGATIVRIGEAIMGSRSVNI